MEKETTIDTLARLMKEEFDKAHQSQTEMKQEINERFDRVDIRIDKLDARLDRIDGRLLNVDTRLIESTSNHGKRLNHPPTTNYGKWRFREWDASKNFAIRLKPGKTRSYRFPIHRMYDLTLTGKYSITVDRYVPGRSRYDGVGEPVASEKKELGELRSNTQVVDIIEP